MTEKPFAIHCHSLGVHVQKQTLLSDISFQIKKGEVVGLMGNNGAGKSTLLKAMVGLIPSMTGTCWFFVENCLSPAARQHRTFLPEKFHVAAALTGRDFLKIVNGETPKGKWENLCRLFDFEPSWLNNPVKTYSKGLLQKLGLIYLFSSEKPVLIADELMSGLDMKTRASVCSYIRTIKQQGVTVLFSTHITYDLQGLCDQVIELVNGKQPT